MDEKETIKLLQELKAIKPRKEWVFLSKKRILGPDFEPKTSSLMDVFSFFGQKWILAPISAVLLLIGAFAISQSSLPGDALYPMKRMSETLNSYLASQEDRSMARLESADKRIDELQKIAETNQAKKLSAALNEIESSKRAVKKEAAGLKTMTQEDANRVAKEMALKMVEINQKESQVLAGLGIEQKKAVDPAEKEIAEILIQEAENSELAESQALALENAKQAFSQTDYQRALEEILKASYPQL